MGARQRQRSSRRCLDLRDYFRRRCRSFCHAFRGGRTLVATQPNARVHAVATVGVTALGFVLRIDRVEWVAVALAMALVWLAEALNTAVELLADEVSLERRERIGQAKDVAAFGVLAAAIGAAAVGLLVFAPRLLETYQSLRRGQG